jgi:hypothetical protein
MFITEQTGQKGTFQPFLLWGETQPVQVSMSHMVTNKGFEQISKYTEDKAARFLTIMK